MPKKLSITDILREKEKYELKKDTKMELNIKRLDATITIQKPERSLCVEAIGMTRDPNQAAQADIFLVYNIVVEPNLRDKELQKAFGCVEPTDIVEKIFEAGEIPHIAQTGLDMAGYGDGIARVTDIKN
ncbi:phage tail assembly chaperone [Bacillus sp. AK031]